MNLKIVFYTLISYFYVLRQKFVSFIELLFWHDAEVLSCHRAHLLPYNRSIKCCPNDLIDIIIYAMCMSTR